MDNTARVKRPRTEDDLTCPVCHEPLTSSGGQNCAVTPFACTTVVHTVCAKCNDDMWGRALDTCPMCRAPRLVQDEAGRSIDSQMLRAASTAEQREQAASEEEQLTEAHEQLIRSLLSTRSAPRRALVIQRDSSGLIFVFA